MTREELAALQVSFTQALDDSPSSSVLPHGWLETASAGDQRRFARYRSGLWRHQEQSLALTYPVIKALVGDPFFRSLAYAYGRRHPSRHPDLGLFGERLPMFLEHYAPVAPYPYFAAVASLEWLIHLASHARDATALDPRALAAMSSAELDVQRFTLPPSCGLLPCQWPVVAIWSAHRQQGQPLPSVNRYACTVLVYRNGWNVEAREVEPWEAAALERLAEGTTLGDALIAAQACYGARGQPQLVDSAALVTRWLNDGLLVAIS
ncbi:HvfC/BufC N-terminal domain-containing protein [Pseudomonas citrulli]|uniref:DNA-binding domain-containing protein n=1 Tax=Pseudomonas citrulli TaxID=3064347 RepID=A0ABT9C2R4_9PSED|nr:DNA-binding domain-containing protein [Pseudomonas sp. K18]MDO7899056.1 DNA-binding domain-containing protein [Pseudomonas sp. K18]